jgi:hypothetical protein
LRRDIQPHASNSLRSWWLRQAGAFLVCFISVGVWVNARPVSAHIATLKEAKSGEPLLPKGPVSDFAININGVSSGSDCISLKRREWVSVHRDHNPPARAYVRFGVDCRIRPREGSVKRIVSKGEFGPVSHSIGRGSTRVSHHEDSVYRAFCENIADLRLRNPNVGTQLSARGLDLQKRNSSQEKCGKRDPISGAQTAKPVDERYENGLKLISDVGGLLLCLLGRSRD